MIVERLFVGLRFQTDCVFELTFKVTCFALPNEFSVVETVNEVVLRDLLARRRAFARVSHCHETLNILVEFRQCFSLTSPTCSQLGLKFLLLIVKSKSPLQFVSELLVRHRPWLSTVPDQLTRGA